jgi:crotonobetainyl-CoA:carnitine CoA-transferase CaiB-like acyl-CoA transferase
VPARVGPNLPTMAPNSLYPTRDGAYVLIAANSDPPTSAWSMRWESPSCCTIRGSPASARAGANLEACNESVAEWTRQHDGAEVERLLLAAEVPVSLVYTIADIYEDPHYAAREMLVRVPHPTLGHTTQHGVVPKLSRTPGRS